MEKENRIAENHAPFFSMHTVTFRARIPLEEWKDLKNALAIEKQESSDNIKNYYKKGRKEIKTVHYQTTGQWGYMHITMFRIRERNQNIVDIKMNPRAFSHRKCPFAYIASEEDIHKCIDCLDNFLKILDVDYMGIHDFKINRIDYCVNIRLAGRDAVTDYMRLMKKGSYPYSAERKAEYDQTQKRWIPTRDSFTVYSDTFEFSIYNKSRQMFNEGRGYSEDDLRAAEGMVRIEYRAGRNKVHREEEKHTCGSLQEFLGITGQIAAENIPRYIGLCYGTGRFVKLDEAVGHIESAGLKEKTKEKMKRMLQSVSKRDLQYEKVHNPDYAKLMKQFNRLGISPVTIQHRSEFQSFENPATYIRTDNANWE